MKQILKVFDYIFILRPVYLYPVWMIFLAGYYLQADYAAAAVQEGANGVAAGNGGFLIVGVALTCLMAAVFVLNQVMERNAAGGQDALSLIAPDKLTPKVAFVEASALSVVALILAFVFSVPVGVLAFLLLLVAGILYNFSPFNWKDKPVLAFSTAGFSALLIFLTGWLVGGNLSQQAALASLPYILTIVALSIYAAIPLGDSDSPQGHESGVATGKETTALYFGLALEIVTLVLAFILHDELIFYPTLFSLPFLVWAVVTMDRVEMARALKYPIFLLCLSLSFKWTLINGNYALFFVLLGIYLFSKVYYRLRFGINYPSLSSVPIRAYSK